MDIVKADRNELQRLLYLKEHGPKELFEYLDEKFKGIDVGDFLSIKEYILNATEEFKLPYKFAVLNKYENLYNLTNKICHVLHKKYKNGIRYSSCFIPMESPGIECSEYNLVLYEEAIEKMKFCYSEIKIKDSGKRPEFNTLNITKTLLGDLH